MKHARPDYDRIQDPDGIIPSAEPVFLIRGQDILAPGMLRMYAAELERRNGDVVLIAMAREHANVMQDWQQKKMPDITPQQLKGVPK